MIALFWLTLAGLAGWRWSRLLLGDVARLPERLCSSHLAGQFCLSPWPALLFRASFAFWFGVLPLTWLTYLAAALMAPILPPSVHPLLVADTFILLSIGVWLAWTGLKTKITALRRPAAGAGLQAPKPKWQSEGREPIWPSLIRSLQQPGSRIFLVSLLIWLLLSLLLMTGTFYRDGALYRAGYSVFSDFAPHTALVSSFSQGRNWPTEYPHFANDGIAYHFMFYFLCGNLNYLGLPLDWAINLPSIIGLLTFCILLGVLAMQLTGRKGSFLLTPLLLFCRSSWAFFSYLGDLAKANGAGPASWPAILDAMIHQEVYIGHTANDSWGLWGVNVYANQRHLLPGLSVALMVLFLLLPDLQNSLQLKLKWQTMLFSRDYWLIRDADGWRRLAAALLLCLLLPYFHGSVLVALLLILGCIAIFSSNRLAFLTVAVCSVISSLIQSRFFAGAATRVVRLSLQIGFIAPDHSLPGILAYLLEMSGILLPLILLAFWLPGRRRKILLASFLLPLVFALTVSLTPDVTVNHKYIMISFAFCNIYVADLLLRIWPAARSKVPAALPSRGWRKFWPASARRAAAVFLAAVLMVTGWQEIIILHNISQKTVAIDGSSELAAWIKKNTAPDAVFVSAPYHYNSFFLSGRSVWLGHSYYAWSAGHDTAARLKQEQWLLTGCGRDLFAVKNLVVSAELDYLILDDTLREHEEFAVDESFFDENFVLAGSFPNLGNMKIYDLRQTVQVTG